MGAPGRRRGNGCLGIPVTPVRLLGFRVFGNVVGNPGCIAGRPGREHGLHGTGTEGYNQAVVESALKNRNIDLLDLHVGLHRFGANIIDVFGAVYLLGLGLSFSTVALAAAASCVIRMVLRPFSLLLSERIGLRKSLLIGTVVNAGLFLVLAGVSELNPWLFFYVFYSALCNITYWLSFHSYNAAAGDTDKRGRQMGLQLGLVTVARMVAPLVGGILIVHLGFLSLYVVATVVMLAAVGPLFFIEDVVPGRSMGWREAVRTVDKRGLVIQMGDGLLYMHGFVWTIVLFLIVGNYVVFGGLVAFELLATAFLFMVLGYFIDKGKGRVITYAGLVLLAVRGFEEVLPVGNKKWPTGGLQGRSPLRFPYSGHVPMFGEIPTYTPGSQGSDSLPFALIASATSRWFPSIAVRGEARSVPMKTSRVP